MIRSFRLGEIAFSLAAIIVAHRECENVISSFTAFIHGCAVVISQPKRQRARHTGSWKRLMNAKRRGEGHRVNWEWKKERIAKKIPRSLATGYFSPGCDFTSKIAAKGCSLKGTHNTRWFTRGVNHGPLERGTAEIYPQQPIENFEIRFQAVYKRPALPPSPPNIGEVFPPIRKSISSKTSIVPSSRGAAALEWKWALEAERRERRGEKLIGIKSWNIYNWKWGARTAHSTLLENIEISASRRI